MPRTRAAQSNPPGASARRGAVHPPVSVEDVLAMIDAARAELGPEDAAVVLAVLTRETDLLRRGALPARPRGRLREGQPSVSPAARTHLRPIRIALAEVARTPPGMTPTDLAALGERVARHTEGRT
jgi:hypothetical protein